MSNTLSSLEAQRHILLQQFLTLGDLRPGSITGFTRRCGQPNCHCAKADDPGHGPQFRLTRRQDGKTVTESFPTPSARAKAQREVDEFHRFQQLGRKLVEVNEKICAQRPLAEDQLSPQEKKRRKRSNAKSPRK
jgi:hypothetical protein